MAPTTTTPARHRLTFLAAALAALLLLAACGTPAGDGIGDGAAPGTDPLEAVQRAAAATLAAGSASLEIALGGDAIAVEGEEDFAADRRSLAVTHVREGLVDDVDLVVMDGTMTYARAQGEWLRLDLDDLPDGHSHIVRAFPFQDSRLALEALAGAAGSARGDGDRYRVTLDARATEARLSAEAAQWLNQATAYGTVDRFDIDVTLDGDVVRRVEYAIAVAAIDDPTPQPVDPGTLDVVRYSITYDGLGDPVEIRGAPDQSTPATPAQYRDALPDLEELLEPAAS